MRFIGIIYSLPLLICVTSYPQRPPLALESVTADIETAYVRVLPDGTTLQKRMRSKFFRDSLGRTRREQDSGTVLIQDPVQGTITIINAADRTARTIPMKNKSGDVPLGTPGPGTAAEQIALGTKQIEGIDAVGTVYVLRFPPGSILRNDKPIEQKAEVWLSRDLKLPLVVKRTDPLTGETTESFTNIARSAPIDPALFVVPEGYTILDGAIGSAPSR
jgi:hypothetical protein